MMLVDPESVSNLSIMNNAAISEFNPPGSQTNLSFPYFEDMLIKNVSYDIYWKISRT